MPSSTAAKKVTTRRRGRPPVDESQKMKHVRTARLTEPEARRFNALMHDMGFDRDNDLLRKLILDMLDSQGIADPGPDSPKAVPPVATTRKKKPSPVPGQKPRNTQLPLLAA